MLDVHVPHRYTYLERLLHHIATIVAALIAVALAAHMALTRDPNNEKRSSLRLAGLIFS
jgi:hypothetical protein